MTIPTAALSGAVVVYLTHLLFQSLAEAVAKMWLGERRPSAKPNVMGPVTFVSYLTLIDRLRNLDRERGDERKPLPGEIDVESLDVIEPVARAIAEPILRRARQQDEGHEGRANGHIAWIATLRRRIAELEIERDEESDPVWKEAIVRRISEIEDEIRREECDWAELQSARARVAQEADAVEDLLVKLGRRRRLLNEMASTRQGAPAPPEAITESISDLRRRLQGLGDSLALRDAGTDRVKAELEMRELEGR